jgi:hypothetical protein
MAPHAAIAPPFSQLPALGWRSEEGANSSFVGVNVRYVEVGRGGGGGWRFGAEAHSFWFIVICWFMVLPSPGGALRTPTTPVCHHADDGDSGLIGGSGSDRAVVR